RPTGWNNRAIVDVLNVRVARLWGRFERGQWSRTMNRTRGALLLPGLVLMAMTVAACAALPRATAPAPDSSTGVAPAAGAPSLAQRAAVAPAPAASAPAGQA